jgi:GLPGLI family protein
VLAQKRITEGVISYDIVVNTGENKPSIAAMFDGATSIVYLKGFLSRSEMISSLGTQATIANGKSGEVVVLKEYGAQKYMINMNSNDWKDANRRYEGINYTMVDEFKEIAGYKCQKAVGKFQDGTTFTVFFTRDLIADNRDFEYAYKSLPGLAMEYETNVGNLKVTYTVAKISFNVVPAAKFELPKSGYRVMTYQESKNAKGNQ